MESLHADDGLLLRWRAWQPDAACPRGTVLLVHGLGEHSGRLGRLAAELAADGWRVIGYDQRGHGESGGPRGRIPRGDSLLADLARVVDELGARQSGPLLLLGDSMGGLVAARFVAEALAPRPAVWSRPVDGLMLASPALDPGMNAWQKLLLAVLYPLAPDLAVSNGLDSRWLSHDPAVGRDYDADPLVHDRISARLARFIVDAGALVRARAAQWRLPTLLLWAGADRFVAPAGSEAFAAAAPPAVVTARGFAGLYHEIFNECEPGRSEVLATLRRWLQQQCPPTVRAAAPPPTLQVT